MFSSDPFEEFEQALNLDVAGKYWMFWTPEDETQTITFEVYLIITCAFQENIHINFHILAHFYYRPCMRVCNLLFLSLLQRSKFSDGSVKDIMCQGQMTKNIISALFYMPL